MSGEPFAFGPTPPPLEEIRRQFPQYEDVDDATLAAGVYEKHYKDLPPEEFRSTLGIPEEAAPSFDSARAHVQTNTKIKQFGDKRRNMGLPAVPPKIVDFRKKYPQYDDLDDETLTAKLRDKLYGDMSVEAFNSALGIAPEKKDEGPSLVDRIWTKAVGDDPISDDPDFVGPPLKAPLRPEGSSLRSLFRQGWQTYQAAKATQQGLDAARDYSNSDAIATGEAEPLLPFHMDPELSEVMPSYPRAPFESEYLNDRDDVSLTHLQRRALAASRGDEASRDAITRDARLLRQRAFERLKAATDERKRRMASVQHIAPSDATLEMFKAETVGGAISEFADDPATIMLEVVAQSLPNMADGILYATIGSMIAGPYGSGAGLGAGSFGSEFRSTFAESLEKEGVDLNDPESMIRAAENPELMTRIADRAAIRGGIIGGLDGVSGGIGSKTLAPFVKSTVAKTLVNATLQAGAQGALGGGGEALAQLATDGKINPGEVLAEVVGEGPTSIVEVGMASVHGVSRAQAEAESARVTAEVQEILGIKEEEKQTADAPAEEGNTEAPAPGPASPASEPTIAQAPEESPAPTEVDPLAEPVAPPTLDPKADALPSNFKGGMRAVVNELADTAGVDLGTIDPSTPAFVEHFSDEHGGIVPAKKMQQILKLGEPTKIVAATIAATLQAAGVKTYTELASKQVVGQASALEHINAFEGLEDLRLPDAAMERQNDAETHAAALEAYEEMADEKPLTAEEVEALPPDATDFDPSMFEEVASLEATDAEAIAAQLGEDAVTAVQAAIEDAARQEGAQVIVDESGVHVAAQTKEELDAVVELAEAVLSTQTVETPTGSMKGIRINDGRGKTKAEATAARVETKKTKETKSPLATQIERAARAEGVERFGRRKVFISSLFEEMRRTHPHTTPATLAGFKEQLIKANTAGEVKLSRADLVGAMDPQMVEASEASHLNATYHFVEIDPGPQIQNSRASVLNMTPGVNHVPVIGMDGVLPIDADRNYVLGNGRTVRIPETPVRREHILRRLEQAFGLKIYQGRVKGSKTRLGFYRKDQGELRIRNANDVETAAHEVAHWMDDRMPWVSNLYNKHADEVKSVSYDAKSIEEGWAEFMRLFMTQEHEARKRAPSFYDALRKQLDAQPEMGKAIDDIQEMSHAWMMQGALARLDSIHDTTKTSIFDRIRSRYLKVSPLQKALDGLRSIKVAELDTNPGKGTTAYNKLRLAIGGAAAVLEAVFFYGTVGFRDDGGGMEITGESLARLFGDTWGDDKMALYMIARRGEELKTQGRENLLRDDEIAAGLKLGDENPEFAAAFDRFQAFNDRMLQFAVDSGILSEEGRKAMAELNKNYVPFNRIVESILSEKSVKQDGNAFHRLRGGTQNINNVWENIITNQGLMIHNALVNDGKRSLYKTLGGATNQKGGLYAAPISADTRKVSVSTDAVLRKIVEGMGMTWRDYQLILADRKAASEKENALVSLINQMNQQLEPMLDLFKGGYDPTGQVDFYMENGEKQFFEIIDPGLWDSIKFMGPKGTNLALTVFGGFSRTLRRGVTATPVFQVKNFIRDTLHSWILSDNVKVPAARALKVVMKSLDHDHDYQEMMINGGGFANRSEGLTKYEGKIVTNPLKWGATYDRFMGRFENANRLAEYKAAREAGDSPRDAAMLSREISTDFAMRGSSEIVRFLATAVPFMNARAQGLYQLGRKASVQDTAVRMAIRGSFLTMASLALYAMVKDDDRYKDLPDDIRDMYWWIPFGAGEDDYFLIPKPFETGMIFGTIPERMMQFAEERDGKEFADALGWMFVQTFAMDPTPQIFQPWLDLERNKTFTGAPIVPMYLDNIAPSQQFTYYTSRTAREAGDKIGVSPIKMDYLFRGYLGTMGTYLLAASDATIRATAGLAQEGATPTSGETWRESIIVKGLADSLVNEGPPRRTKYIEDLFDMVKSVEETTRTVKLMEKRRSDQIEEFLSDPVRAREFGSKKFVTQIRDMLADIRTSMDEVRNDRTLDGDEKRLRLWELQRERLKITKEAAQELKKQLSPTEP